MTTHKQFLPGALFVFSGRFYLVLDERGPWPAEAGIAPRTAGRHFNIFNMKDIFAYTLVEETINRMTFL